MKDRKVSFLMAAHNEDKIIRRTIETLLKLPYRNFELLIGLDGCTDKTQEIVEEFSRKNENIRYYSMSLRNGKPAIINRLMEKADGEIIFILDADWLFVSPNQDSFQKLMNVFDDSSVGGIAESFPLEWEDSRIKTGDLGFKMVAYSTHFWLEFQKKNFSKRRGQLLYVKEPSLFLTNIFRKNLYKENSSLGDDFERTKDILEQGYKIVLLDDISSARVVSSYNSVKIRDLLKQKIRTAMARKQLREEKGFKIGLFNYYLPSVLFLLRKSWNSGMDKGLLVTLWVLITSFGEAVSKFKKSETQSGWTLRAER